MGPVSVSTSGFLYSIGEAGSVLRALVASAAVNLSVGVVLLAMFGITGLAAGTTLAYLTERCSSPKHTAALARSSGSRRAGH